MHSAWVHAYDNKRLRYLNLVTSNQLITPLTEKGLYQQSLSFIPLLTQSGDMLTIYINVLYLFSF